MWLRRGVFAGSPNLEEVGDHGVPGLGERVGIVSKRPQIARRKRLRPKDRKRPSSKRFESRDAQRPRHVSVIVRPMFHFVHGTPCVFRQKVLKTHIIVRSMVGNMRFLLLRLITNHSVNPVNMSTTKEQH